MALDDRRPERPTAAVAPRRAFHASRRHENLVAAGFAVAASALVGQYGLRAWNEYKASLPAEPAKEADADDAAHDGGDGAAAGGEPDPLDEATYAADDTVPGTGGPFGMFSRRFYSGGFDDKMTRREAALILGVRETAAAKRITDAHRRMLMANHPDKGGSPLLSLKINDAKELLMVGKEKEGRGGKSKRRRSRSAE